MTHYDQFWVKVDLKNCVFGSFLKINTFLKTNICSHNIEDKWKLMRQSQNLGIRISCESYPSETDLICLKGTKARQNQNQTKTKTRKHHQKQIHS